MREAVNLFEVLDENNDGTIDEGEFELMFEGIDNWNSHNHNIMNSVLRETRNSIKYNVRTSGNIDLDLAPNTNEKLPYSLHDIHTYPHFFGKKASRIAETRNQDFMNTQIVAAPSKNKRTLSIMDKHGKVTKSPLKGARSEARRSTAHKADQLRAKNQSVMITQTDDIINADDSNLFRSFNNTEKRSKRNKKEDKLS